MRKIGLKTFSINKAYREPARLLYEKGMYDFIEIYVVPGTYADTALFWKDLDVPYVVHAPHYKDGMNLALYSQCKDNRRLYEETARFADALGARHIIFHPGIGGVIQETGRQVALLKDARIIIENKPYHAVQDKNTVCNGYSPEDIALVMRESGCGFCFDVGHCFCAANAIGRKPFDCMNEFLKLGPMMAHISDNDTNTTIDDHRHFGAGNYDFAAIWARLPKDIMVTIETDKDSDTILDDFARDAAFVRAL